jgi:hypothetical protein
VKRSNEIEEAIEIIEEEEIDKVSSVYDIQGVGKGVRIDVEELILRGSMEIEGNLKVGGVIESREAVVNEIKIKDRIILGSSVEEGEGSGIVGEVEIEVGSNEVIVENTKVTNDSVIYVSTDQLVLYEITEIKEGEGFKVRIKGMEGELTEKVTLRYILFN